MSLLLASLNPNLTQADLQRISEKQCETIQATGDAYTKAIQDCPPEYRMETICQTLPLFVQVMCSLMC